MRSHVLNAQDKIGSQLVLDFEAPVLHHARTPVAWRHIIGKTPIQQRRIFSIGGGSEAGKTSVQRLYGSKAVLRFKIRSRRGSAGQCVAKIRVAKRRIIDAVSAADHSLADPSEQSLRSVRKTKARAEVLEVGLRARRILAIDQGTRHGRRNWDGCVSIIGDREIQDGLST